MIDLGEILEEINVPDLSCPLALESKGVATSKNILPSKNAMLGTSRSKRVATSPVKSASREGLMCSLSRFGKSPCMGAP